MERRKISECMVCFIDERFQHLPQEMLLSHQPQLEAINEIKAHNSDIIIAYTATLHPKGFIICSADTNLEPIIAYSFRHDWSEDSSEANILYQILANDLQQRMKAVTHLPLAIKKANNLKWRNYQSNRISKSNSQTFRQYPPIGSTPTGGWIETTWHQLAPYNDFCPIDPQTNSRSLVGCVAVAMAQIVHYHKYIGNVSFDSTDRYSSDHLAIDQDSTRLQFPSFKALNRYLDHIQHKYAGNQPLNDEEIAALNLTCGIAMDMKYSSSASVTFTRLVPFALKQKFKGYESLYLPSPEKFYNKFKENIMQKLPVQLAIANSNNDAAHSVIADGYNTDGFYHLNFGWGGALPVSITDAWYLLPENIGDEFNIVKYGIVDIKPTHIAQPKLSIEPDHIEFEPTIIGETSSIQGVTIKNAGQDTLKIDYLIASENFTISRTGSLFTELIGAFALEADSELKLFICCTPDSPGPLLGTLFISYLDTTQYLELTLEGFGMLSSGTLIESKTISGTWDGQHSPYYIFQDISVETGNSLRIAAGTNVIFGKPCRLTVGEKARLVINGSIDDSVHFRAPPPQSDWNGLSFINSGNDDTLTYFVIRNVENMGDFSGAIHIENSSPTIRYSRLSENRGSRGGALYLSGSNANFANLLLDTNRAQRGGAIYCKDSQVNFKNITVVNNKASETGGAICLEGENRISFKNSIIWDNSAKFGASLAFTGVTNAPCSISLNYCIFDTVSNEAIHGIRNSFTEIHLERGNHSIDPIFASDAVRPYSPAPTSPCIDAGDPEDAILDESMPHGFCINLGAYGGTAFAATTDRLVLTICPNPIDFGQMGIRDQQKEQLVYIKNGCSNALKIKDISISNAARFKVSGVSGSELSPIRVFVLLPGTIDSFKVTYFPDSAYKQMIHDSLKITIAERSPQVVELRAYLRFEGELFGIMKKSSSPFAINGNIIVPDNRSLVIEPGVNLVFAGPYHLKISEKACLKAIGTEQDSIQFKAADPAAGWCGIHFIESADDDTMLYCIIRDVNTKGTYPYYNASALFLEKSNPVVCHSKIDNCNLEYGGLVYCYESAAKIQNFLFSKNCLSKNGGIIISRHSSAQFKNISICDNRAIAGSECFVLYGENDLCVSNSIIWHNEIETGGVVSFRNYLSDTDHIAFYYSNVDTSSAHWISGTKQSNRTVGWGAGNISEPPLFGNDYTLQRFSPCIDGGDPNEDVLNERFPHGYCLNMGSFGGTSRAATTFKTVLTLAPNPLDFGSVNINQSKKLTLYLKNGSPDPIHIEAITVTDPVHFKVIGAAGRLEVSGTGYSLQSGSIDSIQVIFHPGKSAGQSFDEEIQIKTSGASPKSIRMRVTTYRDALPNGWLISQNYPNPFNHQTAIIFQLAHDTHVTIKIFNVLGKEVRILADKRMESGSHKILWDTRDENGCELSSGIYLYQIIATNTRGIRKMVLVR